MFNINLKQSLFKIKTVSFLSVILSWLFLLSCSSVDYLSSADSSIDSGLLNKKEINLVTYNIKAIYDKEESQIINLMKFIEDGDFDFVLFQELFDESVRDEIIKQVDTNNFHTIISRVDYNSFPEFLFQDAGLFVMSRYPRIDLSDIDFGDDINNSNGMIHMILEKEISKTNDFLANKSVLGTLFNINDSTKLFLFTTHVQAIGTKEHKEFQLIQIKSFIDIAVEKIIKSKTVKSSSDLIVLLAGDFNSNAYNHDRFTRLLNLLGNPRDLHKEFHNGKVEYTFRFGSRKPSRRFDYIFAYDNIGKYKLRRIAVKSISAEDVHDDKNKSISDHLALKATLLVN